jgi:hypothetical protein
MKIFKPNKWNVAGALVGIVSGLLIAVGLPLFGVDLFFSYGALFGVVSLLVLFPLLRNFTYMPVWQFAWIICSGLSWYLAQVTALYLTYANYSELLTILVASAVGVTILFLIVAPLVHTARLKLYLILICVTSFITVSSLYLADGLFEGSIENSLIIIHPTWQAGVLYVIVSALYNRKNIGNSPRVVSRI